MVCKRDLESYNKFCSNLYEGNVLYNLDSTNSWGEYLLVVNISTINTMEYKTYSALLIGLRREGGEFVPTNNKIRLTPEFAPNIHFLKFIGHCRFVLVPKLVDTEINMGLVTIYKDVDLHKYAQKLQIRKSKNRKYSSDGRLIICTTNNK